MTAVVKLIDTSPGLPLNIATRRNPSPQAKEAIPTHIDLTPAPMQVGKTDTINTPDIRENVPINFSTASLFLQRIAPRAEND